MIHLTQIEMMQELKKEFETMKRKKIEELEALWEEIASTMTRLILYSMVRLVLFQTKPHYANLLQLSPPKLCSLYES